MSLVARIVFTYKLDSSRMKCPVCENEVEPQDDFCKTCYFDLMVILGDDSNLVQYYNKKVEYFKVMYDQLSVLKKYNKSLETQQNLLSENEVVLKAEKSKVEETLRSFTTEYQDLHNKFVNLEKKNNKLTSSLKEYDHMVLLGNGKNINPNCVVSYQLEDQEVFFTINGEFRFPLFFLIALRQDTIPTQRHFDCAFIHEISKDQHNLRFKFPDSINLYGDFFVKVFQLDKRCQLNLNNNLKIKFS